MEVFARIYFHETSHAKFRKNKTFAKKRNDTVVYGAVTYQRIKVTDAERTEKNAKKNLSGDGSRRGSCEERIRTEQVTDKERSTNVSVTDV